MSLLGAFRVSASGMHAERYRMDVISVNLANANTMRMGNTPPYRRKEVVLQPGEDGMVRVLGTAEDNAPFRKVYEPGNPYAVDGMVEYSNVDPIEEMVSMMSAARAYEANLAAFETTRSLLRKTLDIGAV
jgi:flagellar basal-body rod protein FlgC